MGRKPAPGRSGLHNVGRSSRVSRVACLLPHEEDRSPGEAVEGGGARRGGVGDGHREIVVGVPSYLMRRQPAEPSRSGSGAEVAVRGLSQRATDVPGRTLCQSSDSLPLARMSVGSETAARAGNDSAATVATASASKGVFDFKAFSSMNSTARRTRASETVLH